MKTTKFPTIEEALYLHTQLIERFGGSHGILDQGLLESALGRPRSGHYKSLSEQAAALMHSLAKNHCFVDGNKHMSVALTAVFLLMNGYELKVSANAGESFILNLITSKEQTVNQIASWLEKHMQKVALDTDKRSKSK